MKDLKQLPVQSEMDTVRERNAFIGKVYLLLIASLLTGAGTAALGIHNHISPHWFWPAVLLEFMTLFYAFKVRHEKGYNLVALFAFVASTGVILSIALSGVLKSGHGALILPAAGLTLGVFAILSLYTFISGRDFSFMGGFLFTGLVVLLGGWIMIAFFPAVAPFSKLVLAGVGALVFSGYVLFDTSQMIHVLNTTDYVEATLALYLDVLNLFMDFLRILVETSGSVWDAVNIGDVIAFLLDL